MKKSALHDTFMIIRLWPEHHTSEGLLAELLNTLKRHRAACDEVWFCTETGFPALAVHRRSAAQMGAAAEKLRSAGFLAGIQIANTLGHADLLMVPAEGIGWQRMVGPDGRAASRCNCPRDPDFHGYLREMALVYAAWQPSSVWIDDDLRMHHHEPVRYGCFCEHCLAAFSEQQGLAWDRAALVRAMEDPEGGPLRHAWIRFGQESLATVARVIADAVHSVAPACRMGLQHCGPEWGLYSGPDWVPVFTALADATGLSVGSRPGAGFYNDHAPRGMIDKAFDIARQCARLPRSVSVVCAEVENFTHTAMGKTPHGTAVESTIDLAMGCNALSYAILCAGHEPMEWYGRMLKKLAAWRPFWEAFVRANERTVPGGLEVVFGPAHAERRLAPGEDGFAWAQTRFDGIYQLTTLGLPLCAGPTGASGTLLHAKAVDGLRDAEIEEILRGGVLADGQAVMRLQERGFGKRLGLKAETRPADSFEYFTSDPLNGPHAGHVWKTFFADTGITMLTPTSENARVLGEYRDGAGASRGAATMLTSTTTGGRLAVLGYAGWDHVVSSARRFQMLAAADWVTGGRLPVIIGTPVQVMAIPRVDSRRRLRSVLLLNATIDRTTAFRVRLRGTRTRALQWIVPGSRVRTIRAEREGNAIALTVPPMRPWSVGWLRP
jgi:hypothetical protein